MFGVNLDLTKIGPLAIRNFKNFQAKIFCYKTADYFKNGQLVLSQWENTDYLKLPTEIEKCIHLYPFFLELNRIKGDSLSVRLKQSDSSSQCGLGADISNKQPRLSI